MMISVPEFHLLNRQVEDKPKSHRKGCTWLDGGSVHVQVCVCVRVTYIYACLPNTWDQIVLTITQPNIAPSVTILTLVKFVWLNLLQSEIHLWGSGFESWTLGKTEKEKMVLTAANGQAYHTVPGLLLSDLWILPLTLQLHEVGDILFLLQKWIIHCGLPCQVKSSAQVA